MQNGENLNLGTRSGFIEDLIIVDGITRSGKFLLAHVVAAFNGVEYFQYPLLYETILYLQRHNKISFETAKALLHSDFDNYVYNMMIGRGLNTRVHDLSCIDKAVDPEEFKSRAMEMDEMKLVSNWIDRKRLPLFIGHEGLPNLDFAFSVFPRVKIINMIRDPVSLCESWYRRGWGSRWGHDPKSLSIPFQSKSGLVPWFAVEWAEEYLSMSEIDRVVKSLLILDQMSRATWEKLEDNLKKNVMFISFEKLVVNPQQEVKRISRFINRSAHEKMPSVLQRERLPRDFSLNYRADSYNKILPTLTVQSKKWLDKLIVDYDEFWLKLAEDRF